MLLLCERELNIKCETIKTATQARTGIALPLKRRPSQTLCPVGFCCCCCCRNTTNKPHN